MVYGRLFAEVGLSRSAVDAMYPEDLDDVFAYWNSTPPTNEILAIVHGLTPAKPAASGGSSSEEDVRALAAALGAGF